MQYGVQSKHTVSYVQCNRRVGPWRMLTLLLSPHRRRREPQLNQLFSKTTTQLCSGEPFTSKRKQKAERYCVEEVEVWASFGGSRSRRSDWIKTIKLDLYSSKWCSCNRVNPPPRPMPPPPPPPLIPPPSPPLLQPPNPFTMFGQWGPGSALMM